LYSQDFLFRTRGRSIPHLSDAGRDPRGLSVRSLCGYESPQNVSAVHGKRWDQVEQNDLLMLCVLDQKDAARL
jgi:hypothetical protein